MSQNETNNPEQKSPSFLLSAIPLVVLVCQLTATVTIFGSDSLTGPSQIALLVATAVCCALGMQCCGVKWQTIESAVESKIKDTTTSIYILLIIGMIAGTWMISGIVPTLIYYGIQIIHPAVFLASACLISAVVSVMTGSSWTTIATIGLALIGIGRALGFEDGWTAGAIISGAYFGDKVSPLSDTTVLASSVSGVPLFEHIKYMMYTTVPTMLITLTLFIIAGIFMGTSSESDISLYLTALDKAFCISPWLLIVPVCTAILIYGKVPSLIVLVLSSLMAAVAALIAQQDVLLQIAGMPMSAMALFKGVIITMATSTAVETGVPLLNDLVSTSGMAGMMNTVWLILAAMFFGGAMTACGMLQTFLTAVFKKLVKTRFGLVLATSLNGLALNIMTADQYIAIILSANMFKDEYLKQGYEPRLLSRTTEDSATVTSVLIPWSTCGMTQATVLGVATITYLPFTFFCYLSPVMTLVHALFGWKIKRHHVTDSEA